MKTVADELAEDVARIKRGLQTLLLEHSQLRVRSEIPGIVIISGGNMEWQPLSLHGSRHQTALKEDYSRFGAIVVALTKGLTQGSLDEIHEADCCISALILQGDDTYHESPRAALAAGVKALDDILKVIERLHSDEGNVIVVPDTNALLDVPALETWSFPGITRFSLYLVPTILEELDKLKVEHRNPDVRDKAKALIGRLKEFRRRGDVTSGVPVVSGKIAIRWLAVEPKMADSLPWLNENNNDDRFLASVIEVRRANSRCPVAIVSGDINLLNKAANARIPVLEPPGT